MRSGCALTNKLLSKTCLVGSSVIGPSVHPRDKHAKVNIGTPNRGLSIAVPANPFTAGGCRVHTSHTSNFVRCNTDTSLLPLISLYLRLSPSFSPTMKFFATAAAGIALGSSVPALAFVAHGAGSIVGSSQSRYHPHTKTSVFLLCSVSSFQSFQSEILANRLHATGAVLWS